MPKIESVYATPRVIKYIETHVTPLEQDKWWDYFKDTYLKMKKNYDECIAAYGAIETYKMAMKAIDEGVDREQLIAKGVSCKIGCSHCCHYEVDSQQIEVQVILEYCQHNNIPIDKSYLEAQARWIGEKIHDHPTHSACVFLKDHKCSIYEARPIACRNHQVFSDAALCDAKKFKYPNDMVAMGFHFPTEIFICVLAEKDNSKRGWIVDLLLKQL